MRSKRKSGKMNGDERHPGRIDNRRKLNKKMKVENIYCGCGDSGRWKSGGRDECRGDTTRENREHGKNERKKKGGERFVHGNVATLEEK